MMQVSQPSKMEPQQKPRAYSPFLTFIKSILAVGILLGIITYGFSFIQGTPTLSLFQASDQLTQTQIEERLNTFNALPSMPLMLVRQNEVPKAIETMNLPPIAKQQIEGALDVQSASDAHVSDQKVSTQPTAPNAVSVNKLAASPSVAPTPDKAAIPAKENQVKLAWITLWDTDVEDGDTVKIESQGYSRVVVLKNAPVTFAVPVPASGIINVTGVSDGDGGGITVGLASGASRAIFPIMSEGQVLGLKVKVN